MAYRLSNSVAWQLVNDEVLVVNLATGEALGLNRSASHLWMDLSAGMTDLAGSLAEKYGLELEQAAGDVERFIRQMLEERLIEESA